MTTSLVKGLKVQTLNPKLIVAASKRPAPDREDELAEVELQNRGSSHPGNSKAQTKTLRWRIGICLNLPVRVQILMLKP